MHHNCQCQGNADAIVMEVIDDGVGMSEEELEADQKLYFQA